MKLIILFFLLLLIVSKTEEHFTPSEDNTKYIPLNKKYCLVSKNITPEGGTYQSEIMSTENLPKLYENQKSILINNEFTEDICLNKKFGSGRQRGGFVCVDFLTPQQAKKYNLEYSNKTCYDSLQYTPNYPEYKINKPT